MGKICIKSKEKFKILSDTKIKIIVFFRWHISKRNGMFEIVRSMAYEKSS